MNTYRAGIDIGSTTVKLVLLDENGEILFGQYRRHCAHTQQTLRQLLAEAREQVGSCLLQVKITGSGSINLGKAMGIGFVQEVVAVASALQAVAPQTDVAIELGGEDAKIIYFRGGLEERMNGVCAGGTGSFIDQMASLLQTDAAGLNAQAEHYQEIYPIAARCGVFAKTDIQPLINEGATTADLAASIFQAVVNQTISGLACGKPIRGCVAFLGGPLHFLPELKKAFIRTLKLTPETTVDPENSHLFAAMGAALESGDAEAVSMDGLIDRLNKGVEMAFELKRLDPLFATREEHQAFCARHSKAVVRRESLSDYRGECFLGIDAGSTTTKVALIGSNGQLLFSYYANNQGNPIRTAMEAMARLRDELPDGARIARSCSTGYGESLLKSAFCLDEGEVETIAHCTAAAFFDPEVDCVLDIGGQDMKCVKLKNGSVDTILLNEACSSGCGSFIETFARSMGYDVADFAKRGLRSLAPVNLGSRCTVFMNSAVKQSQKDGASVEDISAGLSISVVKNAIYKVIRANAPDELGKHIVVQGGTFLNDAVLRAFEMELGAPVVRPAIAGLMGAYGAALHAMRFQESALLSLEALTAFTHTSRSAVCKGCQNHCSLTINTFAGGERYLSGNRCQKALGLSQGDALPNLHEWKRERLMSLQPVPGKRGKVGLPLALGMYELAPLWHALFTALGYEVTLSGLSTRRTYEKGQFTIPSDTACYPAKLMHGHMVELIEQGVDTLFYPCLTYNVDEKAGDNHFNCPVVAYYAELLNGNMEALRDVRFLYPYLDISSQHALVRGLLPALQAVDASIGKSELRAAVSAGFAAYERYKSDLRAEGERALAYARAHSKRIMILAGRPYHTDPEIGHGIDKLAVSLGFVVVSEDAVCHLAPVQKVHVLDQWTFHSRLYRAARYAAEHEDTELVQLVSFGCGVDAITTDEVRDILEGSQKYYTQLKIDEITNLGAVKIRLRSLLGALEERG